MRIYVSATELPGVESITQNPLPMFRELKHHREVPINDTVPPEEVAGMGQHMGDRILPYLMQDRYGRVRRPMSRKTIVMENDNLRAEFLPDFGGKLHSLVDLRTGRNLLFSNPVVQPGFLAIRNAWLSGGVEWNVSQFGHTFTTCSPLHFAKVTAESGEVFLRMYDYERQKGLFWQIDFHLPDGAQELRAHVRIVNDREQATSMYWWSNTGVLETESLRIFCATGEMLYPTREKGGERNEPLIGHASLPFAEDRNGNKVDFDVSYPLNCPYSFDYFFQVPETVAAPWEAAAYGDGFMFFERSTRPLSYRKMFCWGHGRGGRFWCDYLSEKGKGGYVEVQAGIARSQMHGHEMEANSVIEFTQVFSCAYEDEPAKLHGDWAEGRRHAEELIDRRMPVDTVYAIDADLKRIAAATPARFEPLHAGSGWGALEAVRREVAGDKPIPSGLVFSESTIGEEQAPWLFLLRDGCFPPLADDRLPLSYIVDPAWRPLLEASLQRPEGRNAAAMNCLATMLYENGEHDEAVRLWKECQKTWPNPLSLRDLAYAAWQQGELDKALDYMQEAVALEQGRIDKAFIEEYLKLLVEARAYDTAWRVFTQAPEHVRSVDRVQILAGIAAMEIGEYDFLDQLFTRELDAVKEGETSLTTMWFKREAARLATERGVPLTEALIEEATETLVPPEHIDFRMS